MKVVVKNMEDNICLKKLYIKTILILLIIKLLKIKDFIGYLGQIYCSNALFFLLSLISFNLSSNDPPTQ